MEASPRNSGHERLRIETPKFYLISTAWKLGGESTRIVRVTLVNIIVRIDAHGLDTSVFPQWKRGLRADLGPTLFSLQVIMHLFGTISFGIRVHRKQLAVIEEAAKLLHVTRNEVVKRGAVAYAREVIASSPR